MTSCLHIFNSPTLRYVGYYGNIHYIYNMFRATGALIYMIYTKM